MIGHVAYDMFAFIRSVARLQHKNCWHRVAYCLQLFLALSPIHYIFDLNLSVVLTALSKAYLHRCGARAGLFLDAFSYFESIKTISRARPKLCRINKHPEIIVQRLSDLPLNMLCYLTLDRIAQLENQSDVRTFSFPYYLFYAHKRTVTRMGLVRKCATWLECSGFGQSVMCFVIPSFGSNLGENAIRMAKQRSEWPLFVLTIWLYGID